MLCIASVCSVVSCACATVDLIIKAEGTSACRRVYQGISRQPGKPGAGYDSNGLHSS